MSRIYKIVSKSKTAGQLVDRLTETFGNVDNWPSWKSKGEEWEEVEKERDAKRDYPEWWPGMRYTTKKLFYFWRSEVSETYHLENRITLHMINRWGKW